MTTTPTRPRLRPLAGAVVLCLALVGASCSAEGEGSGPPTGPFAPDEATTTTSDGVTLPEDPTGPGGVDPADFDPCELVNAGDLAAIAPDLEPVLVRGLANDDPRIDECRMDSVTTGSVSVGVVAQGQGELAEVVGDAIGRDPATATAVEGLGDEALLQEVAGAYVVAIESDGRQLRVRVDGFVMAAEDPQLAVNLARTALGRLPKALPEGGEALPDECADLDVDLVTAVVGEVVLARGGSGDAGFTCDYLGSDGTKAFVDGYRTEAPIVFDLLRSTDRWTAIAGGEKSAVSISGQYFVSRVASDVELVVDTGSPDAADAGFAVDPERRALFQAGIALAGSLD